MSDFMPVNRILETEHVVAFYHPAPAHDVHVLIVPKRKVGSLMELRDERLLAEIFDVARSLVEEMGLEGRGYLLLVYGGHYQDVKQLHFHLISDG